MMEDAQEERRLAPRGADWRRLWRFPLYTLAETATNGSDTGHKALPAAQCHVRVETKKPNR